MINTLYFAYHDFDWKKHHSSLLTRTNFRSAISLTPKKDYHTSYQDIGTENLSEIFQAADAIDVSNLDIFKLENEDFWIYGRIINEIFKHRSKVTGKFDFDYFNQSLFNSLNNYSTSKNHNLWVSGCSITAGIGVSIDESWPILLSACIDMPLVNLAKSGQSNTRAIDQLLRSDVQPNDIVILGITNLARIDIIPEPGWKLTSWPVANYKKNKYWNLDYYGSPTLYVENLLSILQLQNFCRKINANLLMVNFLDACWTPVFLKDSKNYIDLVSTRGVGDHDVKYLDLGDDLAHPGPITHQHYCSQIFNKLQELKYI